MALSDLAIFNEYAYSAMTEVMDQQIALFNAASQGTVVLSNAANQGDYNEQVMFGKIANLIRRRDPTSTVDLTTKSLAHITDRSVKVAAGHEPVDISPSQFLWIMQNPETAGAAAGQQVATGMLQDYLNAGLRAASGALLNNTNVVRSVYNSTTPVTMAPVHFAEAAAKFGDRSGNIAAWVMHSKPMHDLWTNAIANSERLFTYGTVSIMRDPFGRVFIMTDSPSLVSTDPVKKYRTLGLVPGAVDIQQNPDYIANIDTSNGKENIQRTMQAEWSFNVGLLGYAWDKANGGAYPTDTELGTGTNWDKYVTSDKDTAGVLLETN